jgi:hypothetical protein
MGARSRSRVVGVLAAALASVVVTGCGASARPLPHLQPRRAPADATRAAQARSPSPPVTPSGRVLVFFKRTVGLDPLASQLTVYASGLGVALITNGGIDGEHRQTFRVGPRIFRALRRALRVTALHDTVCCDHRYYEYFVSYRGHSWRLAQRRIPPPERGLLRQLNGITNRHTSYSY